MERLPDLLKQSDVVVVAAPLTAESYHLIDADALARMKPDAYLIVVSRGGIVDEDALVDALHEGRLAGAGSTSPKSSPYPQTAGSGTRRTWSSRRTPRAIRVKKSVVASRSCGRTCSALRKARPC